MNTVANKIGPIWDDNNMKVESYSILGTVPNTLCTVDWFNMSIGGIGSTTNPTIVYPGYPMHGTTGEIKFVYGPTSAALSAPTASIGLSGAVGNFISVTPAPVPATSTSSTVTIQTIQVLL